MFNHSRSAMLAVFMSCNQDIQELWGLRYTMWWEWYLLELCTIPCDTPEIKAPHYVLFRGLLITRKAGNGTIASCLERCYLIRSSPWTSVSSWAVNSPSSLANGLQFSAELQSCSNMLMTYSLGKHNFFINQILPHRPSLVLPNSIPKWCAASVSSSSLTRASLWLLNC